MARRTLALLATLVLGWPALAAAQDAPLSATLAGQAGRWIDPHAPIELRLTQPVDTIDGRLALLVGAVDVSDVMLVDAERVLYVPRVPLPSGQTSVTLYRVSADGAWNEIATHSIQVLTPRGFEEAVVRPTIDVGFKLQPFYGYSPADNVPPRKRYTDWTIQAGFESRSIRNGFTVASQAALVGTSFRPEALRFAERGQAAPLVDLSSYQFQLGRSALSMAAGHLTIGSSRHLLNNFASRGLSAVSTVGRRADLRVAVMNATAIVGWNNMLGVSKSEHRLTAGTLGIEFVEARPGGLRAELSVLHGSALPQAGFLAGAVTDAQRSTGAAVRLAGSTAGQRLRIDAGYTRSRFINPADPLLAQGSTLVPVREEVSDARYLEATVAVVPDRPLGESGRLSVALVGRHEQVDPFFKSIGSPMTQADLRQNQVELQAVLGPATVQASHKRMEDNLDDLASALKTLTRQASFTAMLPLSDIRGTGKTPWAPRLSYQVERTHQFGDGVPVNGGFDPSHVPDQQSLNHVASVDWAWTIWRAAYRHSRSVQDNRQPGRERADLNNRTHTLGAGISPVPTVNLNAEWALEQAEALEFAQNVETRRLGVTGDWRVGRGLAFQGLFSTSTIDPGAGSPLTRSTQLDLQASWQFRLVPRPGSRPSARAFAKFARQTTGRRDPLTIPWLTREGWTVTTGLTVSIF